MSKQIYEVNQEAVNEYAKKIGLKYPVKIVGKRGRKGAVVGAYFGLCDRHPNTWVGFDQPTHFITIERRRPIDFLNATLKHELSHCRQVERYVEVFGMDQGRDMEREMYDAAGGNAYDTSRRKDGWDSYWENIFEVEARAWEEAPGNLMKLTKYGREREQRRQEREKINAELDKAAAAMDREGV